MAVSLPKHVDVISETMQDAGSIPAASTWSFMPRVSPLSKKL